MKYLLVLLLLSISYACNDDEVRLQEDVLADYIALNDALELTDLIACAGGREEGLFNDATIPTSIFYYPIEGATDFRYYEAESIADSVNFNKYKRKELPDEPIFNGYLRKFTRTPFKGERMGIVTYKTEGKLHVCNPIRLKINPKPTEVNADLVNIQENQVNPVFTWEDGRIKENVIYFQIISDTEGNLISGTYTIEKNFTFYNLDNVVLNITNKRTMPVLQPDTEYVFTMMAVSEDNWVNLLVEKKFRTK
ncbi:hypothetical protein NBT05_07840 [Aquimarina sp. ERC-38]|uniref:hypothetical protein n=1 Tax=Aquimarina sp. ERC-38 TaxID=2949996 RepID=UPI0022478A60|nr:hypothetical protein [Aquimarina sp. ERC-38]UZO82376.1 hypothetical protein NBT05_07840 [Aquimarina sp. ERC-38]